MQEREYGPLYEGKPTRRDGSASRLPAAGIGHFGTRNRNAAIAGAMCEII